MAFCEAKLKDNHGSFSISALRKFIQNGFLTITPYSITQLYLRHIFTKLSSFRNSEKSYFKITCYTSSSLGWPSSRRPKADVSQWMNFFMKSFSHPKLLQIVELFEN